MKTKLLLWVLVPAIFLFSAWQPSGALDSGGTLADGMKRLVGFTVGGFAHITNTERDERTGLMRVQLSNNMIFALRVGDDSLIDSSSGDTIICFRQIPFGMEHRLVIEDTVYTAQRLQ